MTVQQKKLDSASTNLHDSSLEVYKSVYTFKIDVANADCKLSEDTYIGAKSKANNILGSSEGISDTTQKAINDAIT